MLGVGSGPGGLRGPAAHTAGRGTGCQNQTPQSCVHLAQLWVCGECSLSPAESCRHPNRETTIAVVPARAPDLPLTERRILVYGVTGSGKSTAATRIAAVTGLPLHLADELTWLPGWVPVDDDVQRE